MKQHHNNTYNKRAEINFSNSSKLLQQDNNNDYNTYNKVF